MKSRIAAVLAPMLALALTALGPSPASADVGLTMRAEQTTLDVGGTVVFRGSAPGAGPGNVVELQQRVDQSWDTVSTDALGSSLNFRFEIWPRRGRHSFRAFFPAQAGHPKEATPLVQIRVRRPSIGLTASYFLDDLNRSVTKVALAAPYLARQVLVEQYRWTGTSTWNTTGRTVRLDESGSTTAKIRRGSRYTRYRFVFPGSQSLGWARSNEVPFKLTPAELDVDGEPLTLHDLGVGITATVEFEATTGQHISVAATDVAPVDGGRDLEVSAYAPDGSPLPGFDSGIYSQHRRAITWVAPQEGTYRLDFETWTDAYPRVDSVVVWASTPHVVLVNRSWMESPATTPFELRPDFTAERPGQVVEAVFPAEAGEIITVGDAHSGPCPELRTYEGPDGSLLPTMWTRPSIYDTPLTALLVETSGLQVFRATPCDNTKLGNAWVTIRTGDQASVTVNGDNVTLSNPSWDSTNRMVFQAEAGDEIDVEVGALVEEFLIGPGLQPILRGGNGAFVLPQSGVYSLLLAHSGTSSMHTVTISTHHGN